jgi:hypothetical protein
MRLTSSRLFQALSAQASFTSWPTAFDFLAYPVQAAYDLIRTGRGNPDEELSYIDLMETQRAFNFTYAMLGPAKQRTVVIQSQARQAG